MKIDDWNSLNNLITMINANLNDPDNKILSQAITGSSSDTRAKMITDNSGKSDQAVKLIQRAMHLDGNSNLGHGLREVSNIFSSLGIDLQARVQKTGHGMTLQIMPVPVGQADFYNTRGKELGIKPIEWSVPIDQNGRFVYDNMDKVNMLHATADEQGNLQLLGAAEVALNNVLEQLSYQKNREILRHMQNGTNEQIKAAARRFKYVTSDMTRAAVNVGSNVSNANAAAMSDIEKLFEINGTPHRQDVTQSGVFFGNAFNRLFKKHFQGQGSFAQQEFKVDQMTRLANEMGLLMRSLGVEKGFEVIKRNQKFAPILNNQALALPVLRFMTQAAQAEMISGPISDTHGLDISYLRGVERAFNFLLPDASRKGYQTELVDQDFLTLKRDNAFSKGALWVTEHERTKGAKALSGKTYDTTRFLQLTQEQLSRAIQYKREELLKAKKVAESSADKKTPGENGESLESLERQITALNNKALYSIANGGMLLSKQRANEIAATHVVTKKLRNSDIYGRYNTYLNTALEKTPDLKKAENIKKLEEKKSELARRAIKDVMSDTYGDLATYNPVSDLLIFGDWKPHRVGKPSEKGEYKDELQNFINTFLSNPENFKNADTSVFGIRQKAKLPLSQISGIGKYVTPGGEFRMMSGIMDFDERFYQSIARVLKEDTGLDFSAADFAGIQGIVEKKAIDKKTLIDYASGLFNDELAQYLNSQGRAKFDKRDQGDLKAFRKAILDQLSGEAKSAAEGMMQIKDNDLFFTQTSDKTLQEQFRNYLPAILQAVGNVSKWKGGAVKARIAGKDLGELSAADIFSLLKGENIRADLMDEIKATGIKINDPKELADLVKYSETYHPISLITGVHSSKEYGMPLSKGGMPVQYGYREFDSLDSLINLAATLQHKDLSNLQDYYRILRGKPDLSKQRYQGLMDYHAQARKYSNFNNGTTAEQIEKMNGVILDIEKDFTEDQMSLMNLFEDKEGRDFSTGLPYEEFLQKTALYSIRKKQLEKYRTLSDSAKRELIAKAGGEAAVRREMRNIAETTEWKNKTGEFAPNLIDAYDPNATGTLSEEELLKRAAEESLGASFVPYAIKKSGMSGYDAGNGSYYGEYILGTHLDWRRSTSRSDADHRTVINAGPGDQPLYKLLQTLYDNRNLSVEEIAQTVGPVIRTMYDRSWEQLTEKDKALFDMSTKTSLGHSFQGKVADITFKDLDPAYATKANGAIVVTEHMLEQLLRPNGEEEAQIREGQLMFSDWLAALYGEQIGSTADDVLKAANQALAEDLAKKNSKLNKKLAKDIEKVNKNDKLTAAQKKKIIQGFNDNIERNNRIISALNTGDQTGLTDSDKRYQEALTRKYFSDKIIKTATIGTAEFEATGGRGLVSLLNRFPSLTGVNDIVGAKLLVNPEWSKDKVGNKAIVGGDPALMAMMNADFDGDTINQLLVGSGIDVFEQKLKRDGFADAQIDQMKKDGTYRQQYREWMAELNQDQRDLYTQTREMINFDRDLAHIFDEKDTSPQAYEDMLKSQGYTSEKIDEMRKDTETYNDQYARWVNDAEKGMTGNDLIKNQEGEGRDIFLSKTGKAFTGMFSNVRQAFQNVLRNNNNNYSSPEERELTLASEMLTNFLAVFEQAGISSKKLTAQEQTLWERKLSGVYSKINDRNLWNNGREGIYQIIEEAQRSGILGANDNQLFDLSNMTQRRLFSPYLYKTVKLAQEHKDDEAFLKGLGKNLGVNVDSKEDFDQFQQFLEQVQFKDEVIEANNKQNEFVTNYLKSGKINVSKTGLGNITESLAKAARHGRFHGAGPGAENMNINELGDIIKNKKTAISAYKTYKYSDLFGGSDEKLKEGLTDEDKQKILSIGGVVTDVAKGEFYLPTQAAVALQNGINEVALREHYKTLGEKFFDTKLSAQEFQNVFSNMPEDEILHKTNKETPTRILGRVLPYLRAGIGSDYFADLDTVLKAREASRISGTPISGDTIFTQPENRAEFLKSFQSIEGGNLAHEVAQGMLHLLTSSDEGIRKIALDAITTDGKVLKPITAQTIADIQAGITNAANTAEKAGDTGRAKELRNIHENIFNRTRNDNEEDAGGIKTQQDAIKDVLDIFKPYDKTLGKNNQFVDTMSSLGSGMGISYLKSLGYGIVKTNKNGEEYIDAEALKAAPIITEAALLGTMGGRKVYGRTDIMSPVLSKHDQYPYQHEVNEIAQELMLQIAQSPEASEKYRNEDLKSRTEVEGAVDEMLAKGWGDATTLQGFKTKLGLQRDVPVFKWRIGDFKTAAHGETPSLTNMLQVLMYGQMAETISETLKGSEFFKTQKYSDTIREAKKAITDQSNIEDRDKEAERLFGQVFNFGAKDDEFEKFWQAFKTAGETKNGELYNLYQSLTANNKDAEGHIIEDNIKKILKIAAWTDGVDLTLTKGSLGGDWIKSYDVDLAGLKKNQYAQQLFGRMIANPQQSMFGEDSVLYEREWKSAVMPYLREKKEAGTQFENTVDQDYTKEEELSKAQGLMFTYLRKVRKQQSLIDKAEDNTIRDDERAALEDLNRQLGYKYDSEDHQFQSTLFSKDALGEAKYFNEFIEAFGELNADQQRQLFEVLGYGEQFNNNELIVKDENGKADLGDINTMLQIQSYLRDQGVKGSKAGQRVTGRGLNKWLKAKEENDKYLEQIKDLQIQQSGYDRKSSEYQALGEKITGLAELMAVNQKTIDEQEAIHGKGVYQGHIAQQIKDLKKQRRGYKKGTKEYEDINKQIAELEPQLWKSEYGGATEQYTETEAKYEGKKKTRQRLTDAEKVNQLEEKYAQATQLQQQIAALKKRDLSNLTKEQQYAAEKELEKLQNTLDTEVLNYIKAYEKDIKGFKGTGSKKLKEKAATAKEMLYKDVNADIAQYDANIWGLTTDAQNRNRAFSIYNGVYGAQYALEQNQQSLSKMSLVNNPMQKRLLELEQAELIESQKLAEEQRKKYEAEHPELKNINDIQREKAFLMYQQKHEALTNRPGAIDRFEGSIGRTLSSLAHGYGLHRVLSRLVRSISQLIQQAIGLDKVITNLRIVTGDSKNTTRQLVNEYANLGKAIGVSTAEVASSAVEWLRQGYQTAEVLDLVKSSMYLSKLGMMDASTATQSLTSALKGFKMQATESMDVVDKLTAIDMKAATSAGEIAQGLAQFANLGSLAGVNIDQAAAYVATISDVTQMSGSSAGQALKTIISRYGNVKAGAYTKLNTESESSDENVNINDVERVLSKLGISIRRSNLEFKDFDEVLDSIAEKWNTLDRVSQKAVATAFAGIRQQEAFVTLLQNWDKYQKLLETSENSKGTAEKKMTSYKESFEAAKNSFTAALQEFINRSEVIDLLTKLVKIGTKFVEHLPQILKHLVNIFFTLQNVRALSGKSIFSKGFSRLLSTPTLQGLNNMPVGSTFGSKLRYFFGSGAKGISNAIMGAKHVSLSDKARNWVRGTLGMPAQNAATTTGMIPMAPITAGGGNIAAANTLTNAMFEQKLQRYSDLAQSSDPAVAAKYEKLFSDTMTAKDMGDIDNLTAEDAKLYNETVAQEHQQYRAGMRNYRSLKRRGYKDAYKPTKPTSKVSTARFSKAGKRFSKGVEKAGGAGAVAGGAVMGAAIAANQVAAGLTAYQMIGQTHKNAEGKDVQSSETARKKGGAIAQTWTTLLPVIGQIIGEKEAQKVMARIDGVRDSINSMSEKASQIVNAIKNITGEVDTLSDLAKDRSIDNEKMNEALNAISSSLYSKDNKEARQAIQKNLSDNQTIYDVLRKYRDGTQEERAEAARELKLATIKAEHENNEKVRQADLYNQQNTDIDKNRYLDYRKLQAQNGKEGEYDSETGLSMAGLKEANDIKHYTGTTAAATGGAVLAGIGTALLATGVGSAVGAGLLAGGALLATAGSGAIYKREHEAAIAEQQEAEFQAWNSKSIWEKQIALENERNAIIEAMSEEEKKGLDAGEKQSEYLESIDAMLSDIKDTTGLLLTQIEEQNREKIQESILTTKIGDKYLTDMSEQEMKNLGPRAIMRAVGAQIVAEGGMANKHTFTGKDNTDEELTVYAEDLIRKVLMSYSTEFKDVLSGSVYTLSETLQRLDRPDLANDKDEQERLKNFATALGISTADLQNEDTRALYESRFGMLKLSEILGSTSNTIESIGEFSNLMGEMADGTKSTTQWMSEIVSKYPELIAYMSDTPKLLEKMMTKIKALVEIEFVTQWTEIMNDNQFFETMLKETEESVGYKTLKSQLDELAQTGEAGQAQADTIWGLIRGSRSENMQDLVTYLLREGYNGPGSSSGNADIDKLGEMVMAVGNDYQVVSDKYEEQLQRYIESNVNLLDRQLTNLEEQKQALQNITQQREYENKLIEAKLKLENAMEDKKRVYRAGVGFVYEADQDAIAAAEKDLEAITAEKQISALDAQTNILQSLKDSWNSIYEEKSYKLQEEQANKFNEYILENGENGFKSVMQKVSDASAATEGATKNLADLTKEQFTSQLKVRQEKIAEAAKAYNDYMNSNGDNNALAAYHAAQKAAIDAGGTNEDIAKASLAVKAGKTSTADITGYTPGNTDSTAEEKAAIIKTATEDIEAANKEQETLIDFFTAKTYFSGEGSNWLRTFDPKDDTGNERDKIANYVVGDAFSNDTRTLYWSGNKEDDLKINIIGSDGKLIHKDAHYNINKLPNNAKKSVYKVYDEYKDKRTPDAFFKKIASDAGLSAGQTAVVMGRVGATEYVVVHSDGSWDAVTPINDVKTKIRSTTHWYIPENAENNEYIQGGELRKDIPKPKKAALGTLDSMYNKHTTTLINELGTEAIITPSGTITALPSHTGIVPADITKNLWALGEVAPALIRILSPKIVSDHIGLTNGESVTDESFNISTLNMNVTADESFDADAFVDSIKIRANLTKNMRR